jgi:hypothetical protein
VGDGTWHFTVGGGGSVIKIRVYEGGGEELRRGLQL